MGDGDDGPINIVFKHSSRHIIPCGQLSKTDCKKASTVSEGWQRISVFWPDTSKIRRFVLSAGQDSKRITLESVVVLGRASAVFPVTGPSAAVGDPSGICLGRSIDLDTQQSTNSNNANAFN